MRFRTVHALAVAALFLAPSVAAGSSLTLSIANGNAGPTVPFAGFDAPGNPIADFDGDGRVEIVAHSENRRVYVLDSGSGKVRAELAPPYPPGWGARAISDAAVADVDSDGRLEVVVTTSAATLCVYTHEPWRDGGGRLAFREMWCRRGDAYDGGGASADGGPWVEDVTGDGRAEIFMQTETRGLFAFNHDGSLRWSRGDSAGNAGPTVADLDGDGRKEALFFSDNGIVRALDASTGSQRWAFFATSFVHPAAIPVSGSVGDLDNDGKKEVVFFAREAVHTSNYKLNHFGLFVLDSNGRLKWWAHPSWGNPLSYTHPILHDVNGDGKKDIVGQDWNTIGHKPGNWEQLGPANVFAYAHDGRLLWTRQVQSGWSNDDPGLADMDGDGALDVVAVGWGPGGNGAWILDARTGAVKAHVAAPGLNVLRGPTLGNFAGDGMLGWALPGSRSDGGGFAVYRTDARCLVAYGGWQMKDPCRPLRGGGGGSPAPPPSPPPPPPPPGGFSASFVNPRGNNYWVESDVVASEPLAGVDARVNGGGWISLPRTSWGSWAKSFFVATGSLVEFRARGVSGMTVESGGYSWPSATPVGGGGGGGGFSATFSNPRGNSWWVETDVGASGPLAGVDARVNGGAWIALSSTSWGSFAKSFFVAPGSTVEFRARSTAGDAVVSGPVVWPP